MNNNAELYIAQSNAFNEALRKATDNTIARMYMEWTLYYAKHTDASHTPYYNPRYLLRKEVGRRQRERTEY